MPSVFHIRGRLDIANQSIDWLNDTIKVMLVKSTYVDSNLRDFVDDGTANDPLSHECDATNYTGGFAGAGRKTITSKTITRNNGANRVEYDCAAITWTALGGAVNNTIGGVVFIKEITDDTASIIIGFDDGVANQATNGNDFVYTPNANGIFHQ